MTTQPEIFASLFSMLESSAPETNESRLLPPGQKPDLPQQGIFDDLFAAAATQHYRDGWPGQGGESIDKKLQLLTEHMERIESLLERLVQQRTVKDWYTIVEAAEILHKAEFTVREWCRLDRVRAQKRACGRGRAREWMIAHDELLRIQNEGLLPQPTISTRLR